MVIIKEWLLMFLKRVTFFDFRKSLYFGHNQTTMRESAQIEGRKGAREESS